MSEQVNHPAHYNIAGKRECIEAMKEDYGELITTIFCLTNAYKYLYRAGMKEGNSQAQDIAKAKWYYDYQKELVVNNIGVTLSIEMQELEYYILKELKKYGCEN